MRIHKPKQMHLRILHKLVHSHVHVHVMHMYIYIHTRYIHIHTSYTYSYVCIYTYIYAPHIRPSVRPSIHPSMCRCMYVCRYVCHHAEFILRWFVVSNRLVLASATLAHSRMPSMHMGSSLNQGLRNPKRP